MSAKILVVDDEPNLLRLMGYALQAEGYDVLLAKNGEEALDKIQVKEVDLVILDVMMPDMSGIDVCKRLRSSSKAAALPIIMLSARAQVIDKIKGLEAGADEYLTKPIDTEEMVARVAALLERTKRLRETQPLKQGKVLGFMGAKGGVGTTTVALNVAVALAKRKQSVIAVELRPDFGTFSVQLGRLAVEDLGNLLKLEPKGIDLRELRLRLVTHVTGLQVLFGTNQVEMFRTIEPDQAEVIIKGVASLADKVVLDLPNQASLANWTATRLCDFVTLVVGQEPDALIAAHIQLEMLKSWGVHGSMVGIVIVNRAPAAANITLGEIRSQFDCEIIGVVPPAIDACMLAQRQGVPLVVAQPNGVTAGSLTDLAQKFETIVG